METVKQTIDGREVTVEKGKTVLQAAIEHGISVPYYCYHPGIGIDGSCRVCIVKIEKMPKLETSCSTVCTDGIVVSTRTPEVVEARAGVFEFLLVNHPLDCPVCDKGGECPLQDFSYSFGPDQSRMEFPRRVFDGDGVKGDVDFGPTLMLNRQRCILCTRCVRFMRDIDSDAQINIIDRGYGSEIGRFNYHWIEGDNRLRRPLQRDANGVVQPSSWHDVISGLCDRLAAAGVSKPNSVRFLLSAHASHEELFLFRRIAEKWVEASGG